jgi:hypothetical protein
LNAAACQAEKSLLIPHLIYPQLLTPHWYLCGTFAFSALIPEKEKPLKSARKSGAYLGAGTGFEPVTFRL